MRNPIVDTVATNFPAAKAGFQKGDSIVAVNGQAIRYWHQFTNGISKDSTQTNQVVVSREGMLDTLSVSVNGKGIIGVNNFGNEWLDRGTHLKYTFGESIASGFGFGYNILKDYVKQFKYVFTTKGASQVGGFGAIGNLFPDQWDWLSFWQTTALISIILAFMNVLPIPALDGGHVMFLLYEMISGKKPSDKFMEYAQMIGFFLLIALVLYANGNDIYRWLFK